MSSVELLSLLVQFLVVTAIAFVVIVGVASVMRFQGITTLAEDHDGDVDGGEEAFHALIARAISQATAVGRPFSIGMVEGLPEGVSQASLLSSLRGVLRPADRLFGLGEGRAGLLLASPVEKVPSPFARMLELMSNVPGANAVRMGVAGFPQDGDRLDPLLEQMAAALQVATPGSCAMAEGEFEPATAPTEDDPLAEIPEDQRDLVDPIAGVLVEADFVAALQKLVAKARRYGDPVSLLCFGVEHLQRYQEHYGDEGVDAIVGHVGRIVRTGVREIDIPGRLANHRVAIVIDADVDKSVMIARRLIEQARNQLVYIGTNSLKVTLDCGIAGYPVQGDTGRRLMQRALVALDLAASSGHGACEVYDPEQDKALHRPQPDSSQDVF